MKISTTKKYIKKALIVLFWLAVWEGAAFFAHNSILLAGPIEVVGALIKNLGTLEFYQNVAGSLGRIGLGFAAAFILGMIAGTIGYRFHNFEELLAPAVNAIKSIPVASFVVLLLIWAGSENLSFFICILIVFPNIYVCCLEGLKSTDPKMLEMADTFDFGFARKWLYIYRYSLLPHLMSSLKVTLGMAWKSGVAAEVIGLPSKSIGERIYTSKVYLDTADLFAWTLTVIVLSFVTEKLVLVLAKLACTHMFKPNVRKTYKNHESGDVVLNNISASYGDVTVIDNMNLKFVKGGTYVIMGPSGCGKTTLLKEIAHKSGTDVSVMFQEDRLIENADAISNILLGSNFGGQKEIEDMATKLLPKERLHDKVCNFSGGMKRRVALLRTLVRKADLILLDEPFSGLDDETRLRAIELINDKCADSIVVCVSHNEEDAAKLGGEIIWMKE